MPAALHTRTLRDVGRRIRESRLAAGLTQEQAAHRARVEYKYWQKIERGVINLELKTIDRIARALGTTFWKMITRPVGRAPKRNPGNPRQQKAAEAAPARSTVINPRKARTR